MKIFSALLVFPFFLLSPLASRADSPLVIAKVGDLVPAGQGMDGSIFTELSAPVLTEDGTRVAILAEIDGNEPTWWFGDLGPDGFYDLKLAARSGMTVSGSGKLLDLFWLPDPNAFGDLRPNDLFSINLDPITGKLAFVGYLNSEPDLGNPSTAQKALFIADDAGITLVSTDGKSDFTYVFSEQQVSVYIDVREVKYINDRLLFTSFAINEDDAAFGDPNRALFIYENGQLDMLFMTSGYEPTRINDGLLGEVYIENIGRIVINENGKAAVILSGFLANPINGRRDASLIQARLEPTGANRLVLDTVLTSFQPAPGYVDAEYADFREITINRFDDLVYIALVRDNETTPILNPKGLYWLSLTFPSEGTIARTGVPAKGYPGELSTITDIYNVQAGGEYVTAVVAYPGEEGNFYNAGILRTKIEAAEPEDLVFYIGGPSNVGGLGNIYDFTHILMGTNGDLVCQLSTGDGFTRALLTAGPPDNLGTVTYNLIATSEQLRTFTCEDSCPSFIPFLPTIGFIPRGPSPNFLYYPGLGPETGFGQWVSFTNAGWVFFESQFTQGYREYSVVFDLDLSSETDYGDAPADALNPAPLEVPTGYPLASHIINPDERLGLEVDAGVAPIDSLRVFQYYGIDDDTSGSADEDGVEFLTSKELLTLPAPSQNFSVDVPVLETGATVNILVTASAGDKAAYLNGWIDFNRDGKFQLSEQIITTVSLPANTSNQQTTYPITLGAPFTISTGYTFARFRISGNPETQSAGIEDSGEVEDYLVKIVNGGGIEGADFGDAPSDGTFHAYPTTLANDGARHTALLTSPLLGEAVDYEVDGIPSDDADGDDTTGSDDEDGVALPVSFPVGNVAISVTATMDGKLDAWFDFNRDGDWDDPGEKVFNSIDVVAGENILQVTVPGGIDPGVSYARFRISGSGGLNPTGAAQGGEVEDYKVLLGESPKWAGYDIMEGFHVDTGNWLGFLEVSLAPWCYSYPLQRYVFLPEENVTPNGAWVYLPK